MSIWQAVGFHMVIWLSGLQTIPRRAVRGGRRSTAPAAWQQFRYVTWPGLRQHPHVHPGHHHHRRVQPVRPDQRHDQGRPAGLHHHRRLPGRPRSATSSSRPATPRRSRWSSSSSCSPSPSSSATSPETRTDHDDHRRHHGASRAAPSRGHEQSEPQPPDRVALRRPDPAGALLRLPAASSCSCPRSNRTTQIFADLGSLKAFLPVGDISLDNYTGVFQTVPVGTIPDQLDPHLRGHRRSRPARQQHGRVRPVPDAVGAARPIVLAAIIATLVVPFETFALPLVWWVNKLPWLVHPGLHPAVLGRLARHLPGADHPVHRQRLLDLPLLLLLPEHPEGARRSRPGRRRRLVPHLPQRHHAAGRPGHRHRRDPHLPPGLELLPVAADGGADRRPAPRHGRPLLLPATQRRSGARSWPTRR